MSCSSVSKLMPICMEHHQKPKTVLITVVRLNTSYCERGKSCNLRFPELDSAAEGGIWRVLRIRSVRLWWKKERRKERRAEREAICFLRDACAGRRQAISQTISHHQAVSPTVNHSAENLTNILNLAKRHYLERSESGCSISFVIHLSLVLVIVFATCTELQEHLKMWYIDSYIRKALL